MKFNSDNFICGLISFFVGASIIMFISYVHTLIQNYKDTPFNMTINHVVLQSTSDRPVHFDDVIDIDQDQMILLVSKTRDTDYLGIYDPLFSRAYEQSVHSSGYTRYFSMDDYRTHHAAGILVLNNFLLDLDTCFYKSHQLVEEILYCTDNQNSLQSDGTIRAIVNASSLESLGDTIYLDASDKKEINKVVEKLKKYDYEVIKMPLTGLFEALTQEEESIFIRLLRGSVLLYGFFGFAMYASFINQKEALKIHLHHGGTLKRMMGIFCKPYLRTLGIGLIPLSLWILWMHQFNHWHLSFIEGCSLLLIHCVASVLIMVFSFKLVFRSIQGKEALYVR